MPEKLQSAMMLFTLFRAGMCSPLPWERDQYLWCLRITNTSNLTWVKVNVESRTEGAGSPHTADVDSENWKLAAKRKPNGLRRMGRGGWEREFPTGKYLRSGEYLKRNWVRVFDHSPSVDGRPCWSWSLTKVLYRGHQESTEATMSVAWLREETSLSMEFNSLAKSSSVK